MGEEDETAARDVCLNIKSRRQTLQQRKRKRVEANLLVDKYYYYIRGLLNELEPLTSAWVSEGVHKHIPGT